MLGHSMIICSIMKPFNFEVGQAYYLIKGSLHDFSLSPLIKET